MGKFNFYKIADKSRAFKAIFYGDTGTAKTTLAATAVEHPHFVPALLVNFDKGLASITHVDPDGTKIKVVDFARPYDAVPLFEELAKDPQHRTTELRDIRTVIVDSISAFRDSVMDDVRNEEYDRNPAKRRSPFHTQIQDYNIALTVVGTAITKLRDLDINFILIAQEREVFDQDGNLIRVRPELNPQLYKSITYKVSHIWHTEKKLGGIAVRMLEKPGVESPYLIKNRAPRFIEAVRGHENMSKGTHFFVPDYKYPFMKTIYDIYESSLEESNE